MPSQANDDIVVRVVEAAARAVASVKYCWLATPGGVGPINARPMGRTPRALEDDEWLLRFVTDDRSRKISEIRRGEKLTVILQRDADDTYISLFGGAAIRTGASADSQLWRASYNAYFPGKGEREHAVFIEVRVDRMALWIRDVTPEPFGLRPTTLERDAAGVWRLID